MIRIKTAIRGVGLATFILFVLFASPVTIGFMVLLSALSSETDVATVAMSTLVSEYWSYIIGYITTVMLVLKYETSESDLKKRKEE